MLRNFTVSFALGLVTWGVGNQANAGWGSWGGSGGGYGSSGSVGGSSGGSFGGAYGSSGGSVGSYGSQGSWGGYASSGGSWAGSQGGSNGSWGSGHSGHHHGPLARLFAHWHHKKLARRAAFASSGGSWGGSSGGGWGGSHGGSWGGSQGWSGYGSSGGSSGSWGESDVSVGCDDCGGAVTEGIIESTPAVPMESEPIPPTPDEARRSLRKGVLMVSVPADAKVLVNGESTRSTGDLRRYVSHGLKRGETYRYVVKAIREKNGEPVEQTKVAVIRAGKVTSLDFNFDGENSVETSLTLNVPEDAQVYLSGHETKTAGNQRRFSTTKIEDGQKWADYVVQVTVNRDGQTVTKQKRVTLNGGDQAELTFDFDQAELVAAR